MADDPDNWNNIEEYELDSEPQVQVRPVWQAWLRLDGSVYNQFDSRQNVDADCRLGERGKSETLDWMAKGGKITYGDGSYGGWMTPAQKQHSPAFEGKSYVSPEHALKLAVEQRQKALREHPEWFV